MRNFNTMNNLVEMSIEKWAGLRIRPVAEVQKLPWWTVARIWVLGEISLLVGMSFVSVKCRSGTFVSCNNPGKMLLMFPGPSIGTVFDEMPSEVTVSADPGVSVSFL
jgi:hypothetical protein